ncbi:hypothetical protein M2128_002225, partial [Polynucleobacter sphagniphilus]|uniref:hypothetical protein n=1 Tax=Polynucleobacter sphagniphilus TaxID=1743169 RepID=UPI0024737CBA
TSLNLIATGGQIDINSNITAGQVYAVAQAINVNGSINTNGGNNSNIYLAGAIINILGNINSNGSNSNNSNNTNSSNLNSANTTTANIRRNGQNGLNADSNTYTSNGGLINILATGDINIGSNSYISANGINGGAVTIVSTAGKTSINGIVDSIGKATNGGNIAIVGKTQTDLIGALISSEGLSQGGVINLGQVNNLGNGTILAPPATAPPALTNFVNTAVAAAVDSNNSITSSNINLDSQTGINAPNGTIVVFGDQIQINNSSLAAINGDIAIGRPSYSQGAVASLVAISNSTLTANRVETSGDLLGTQNTAVVSNEWLLDPTTVTITAAASTGVTLASTLAATGASNISTADIVAAINAGNTVNVVATGAITQTGALAFAPATGITGTLILDNHLTQGSSITSSGGITSSGAGTVNLQFLAGGQSLVSGAITASSGPINVVMQSYWEANTTNFQYQAAVLNTAPITTRGGYVIMDGTGGTIDLVHQTITMGTVNVGYLQNIYPQASINTTTNAGVVSATSTGGNFIGAGYSAVSGGINGAYESSGATLNIGGFVNIQAKSAGTNWYGYVISAYGAGPINAAGNITITANSSSTGIVGQDIYLSTGTTLTSYTGSVNISNTSTGNGGGIAIYAAISAATGITINNTNVGAIGVQSNAAGTLTTTAGTISITSTSTGSGVYAESLAGLITAPKVTITGTNSTAGGLGASVTGGVTITNVAGTYASVGDALNITTTVGTNGTTGGINVTTGAITNNSNGGDVTFKTNGDITATSAVSFATANTTNHVQTLTYDTRTGNLNSQITAGIFTFNATGATSKVNYQILSNGSALTIPAVTVSGTILLDNTCASNASYTCSTPLTASSATTVNTTASVGISLTGAQISGQGITINGINASASNAAVALGANGLTVTSAASFLTAEANAISVIGYKNTANIGNPGISSTGAIAVQSAGGDVLFQSNGDITQTGGLTLSANTTAYPQNVKYDTTSGNGGSAITIGAITSQGTSISAPVNVTVVATGAITQTGAWAFAPATGITGTLILDNHATSGVGIALSGGITSSGAGTVNLKILSGSTINQTGVITATGGPINVVMQSGQSTAVVGAYGSDQIAIGAAITTRGGYVIIDGTGGTIDTTTQTIAAGNNTQGGIYFGASIDTSIAGAASTGNVVLSAVSGALASSATTFINGGTVNSGAGITWNGKQNATAGQYNWGFSINNHSSACPWTAIGDIAMIMNSTSTDASASNPIYISSAITSTSGSVTIASNQTVSGNDLAAVTISGPITGYTGVSITGRTATGSSSGITLNGAVSSTTGPVTIIGTSTTGVAINGTSAGTLAGQSISVSGTGTTATTVVSLAAMTTNSCSSSCNTGYDISVTANDTAAGANAGISQTGAIAQNANGGNITFTSNNSISVAGPISMVANTSGVASLVSYVNTAGNASSVVNDAPLTVAAGSTSAVNYSILANGGSINSGSISVPGYISLDNTNGGTVLAANATTGTAILVTGVLTSGAYAGTNAITLKAIAGTGGVGINDTAATDNLIAPVGNITLNSVTSTGAGITYASPITATSGSVSITGTSITGTAITATGLITGLGITVNGTATTAATITSLGALTVNGLYAAGTTAAPTFISNSSGTYIGAINALPTLLSGSIAGTNTGLTGNIQAATVVYAMAGNTSTNANYLLGWGAAGAPLTRMVQLNLQLSNGQLIATETAAKTNATALTTGGGTNINTLWTGGTTATTQSISLATAGYGIANIGFSDSPVFTSAGSGDLTITATGTAGSHTGITQTGAITQNANGGNITFTSNNAISQSGAVTVAPNTSGTASYITYNTTSGNQLSTISTGALTIGAGTSSSAINYIEKSNGAALTIGATTVPGYISVDNTCSSCGTPLTPTTAAASLTTGVGVTVSGALSAANYISIAGINASASNAAVALGANGLTVTSAASFPTAGVKAISVIGYKNTANIGNPGISSTGAIAVQSAGGDVLFQSNGDITQTGGLTLSANTTAYPQNVKYDTTSGNGGSAITIGAITSQGTSISAPVNVTVVATGAITQTGAWAFAPATGITDTLILDNHLTQGSSITSSGGITSSGAGTVNLQFLAGGQSIVSGAITASSGPINVVMQSYWRTNTTNILFAANVLNTAPITTRGGYVIMDGTGGTIDLVHQTITMGTVNVGYLQNIYPQASINTTTNAGPVNATSTGGNFIAAGYDAVSGGGLGPYESAGATLNIGGFVNIQVKTAGTNSYGYVINYHGPGPINAAGNITIAANSSSTGILDQDIYLSAGTTLTSYTGSVNISNTSTGNGGGIAIYAAISAATGITINNTNVGAIGVQSNAAGTLTTTAGTISITSTSTGSGVYAVSLAGLITAPKVTITGTNSTAGGLGASVTGGVTITAGTYASVGDALNITTTVGTNGTTGGINVTTGAITNNSNGGSVTLVTNGDITASAAVNFATANTTNHAQTITYDTTSGNLNSQITTGSFTYASTGALSPVNYIQKASGSALTVGTLLVSGYITIDNTFGCSGSACTPTSGYLTNGTVGPTTVTQNGAGAILASNLTAGGNITINGVWYGSSNSIGTLNLSAGTISAGQNTLNGPGAINLNLLSYDPANSSCSLQVAGVITFNSGTSSIAGGGITILGGLIGPGASA